MKKLERKSNTPLFVPNYMAKSVMHIDFNKLAKSGITHVAFDADSTLVNYRGRILDKQSDAFLKENRKLFKGWCIASNRLDRSTFEIAAAMSAGIVRARILSRKPNRHYYQRLIDHFGVEPSAIAMVGDKLIADVWGANRMGLKTVWVERLGDDSWLDRMLGTRRKEAKLMKKLTDTE